MASDHTLSAPQRGAAAHEVAALVGQLYDAAPPAERVKLLEHLIRPLGALSLLAVANGLFAGIRLRGGWQDVHVRVEDAMRVHAGEVADLADYLQCAGADAVDGLVQLIAASPALAATSVSALLVTALMRRSRWPLFTRRARRG